MQWQAVEPQLEAFIAEQQLPADFSVLVKQWYWPLAQQLQEQQQSIRVLGINGAQGTGKSTLASLLKLLLKAGAGINCAVLSLDDFYLTLSEREDLSHTVHPLLKTRGVPGTHDVSFALSVINALLSIAPGQRVSLPRFDKSTDDRMPEANWSRVSAPVDLVILEGWCIGSSPQRDEDLMAPVNNLEREQDSDGQWRHYVNNQLTGEYQQLFSLMDSLVMLKAPSMEVIQEWRWLQEKKLMTASGNRGEGLMSEQQIAVFIQHYERLTRHGLNEMSGRAELVYHIGKDHRIESASGPWSSNWPGNSV
jgi:D-glycerate 3-kinase